MEVAISGPLPQRPLKRLYQQQQEDAPVPFQVTGVHAMLFDDDTLAAFTNSPAALLPWNGDESLLIDRFDVRHLLQDLSGVRKRRPPPPQLDVTEEELNYERYRDLEDDLEQQNNIPSEEPEKSLAGGYQAVPFSYSSETTLLDNITGQSESGNKSIGFVPSFPVPGYLQSKLPPSEKLHQIISATAKFVSEHGGQSEILLKVKQGNNPMFGFLNVDHELHEYYKYLLKHPELLNPTSTSAGQNISQSAGEGLSLLGSAYGTGDDDDDDDEPTVNTGSTQNANGSKLSSAIDAKLRMDSKDVGLKVNKLAETRATTSRETEPKATKVHVKTSSRFDKKNKSTLETKECIQPNKSIAPQLPFKELRHAAKDKSLPRSSEQKGSWHPVPSVKDREYGMSADAAAAVVLATTRGIKAFKQDSSCNKSTSSSGLSQKGMGQASGSGGSADAVRPTSGEASIVKAMVQAAAAAAAHEADSADALLTPAEKLKAERLRRAKMFAAMIKSGTYASGGEVEQSGVPTSTAGTGSGSSRGNSSENLNTKHNHAADQNVEQPTVEDAQTGKHATTCIFGNGKSHSIEHVEDSDSKDAKRLHERHHNSESKDGKELHERDHSKSKREYRSEIKEHRNHKHSRSDSEESRHHRKRRHKDRRSERKHKHGRHKRHESHHSDSVESGSDSGYSDTESKRHSRSKSHRCKKESDHHGHRRHRNNDHKDTLVRKHKADRGHDKDCTSQSDDLKRIKKDINCGDEGGNENKKVSMKLNVDEKQVVAENKKSSKKIYEDEEQVHTQSHSKAASHPPEPKNSVLPVDVPADIRAKVREMLLSTF